MKCHARKSTPDLPAHLIVKIVGVFSVFMVMGFNTLNTAISHTGND